MGIGFKIKFALFEENMRINELAEKTGIPVNTLYAITKRDSKRINPVYMKKIADVLNRDEAYFLDDIDSKPGKVEKTPSKAVITVNLKTGKILNVEVKYDEDTEA